MYSSLRMDGDSNLARIKLSAKPDAANLAPPTRFLVEAVASPTRILIMWVMLASTILD